MNEPGLLALVTIGADVKIDPRSVQQAIRQVEKAFGEIRIQPAKIPTPDISNIDLALARLTSRFNAVGAQISRTVNVASRAIHNLGTTISALPSEKLIVPEATPMPPGRWPGEEKYLIPGGTPMPPGRRPSEERYLVRPPVPILPELYEIPRIAPLSIEPLPIQQSLAKAARQLVEAYAAIDVSPITRGARETREAIERGAAGISEAIRTMASSAAKLEQVGLDSAEAAESGASALAEGISQVEEAISNSAASVKAAADSASSGIERSTAATAQATVDASRQLSDAAEAASGSASSLGEGAKKVSSATESLRRLPLGQIADFITVTLAEMQIEPEAGPVKEAAKLIKDGVLTFNQALDALRVGFAEPARVLEAIGEAAGTTVNNLSSAKAAFAGLNAEQFSRAANKLRIATNAVALAFSAASSRLASVAKPEAELGILQIKRALELALTSVGVTVRTEARQLAAMYVKQGVISFDEAVEALAYGSKNASRVIRELAGNTGEAAKIVVSAVRQLYGIGPPPSPPGGGPPAAMPGASPEQTLQLAAALSQTSEAGKSFMQVLMGIRWQMFTVLFFVYGAIKAFKALSSAVVANATTIDRVSSAVTVLRARGVKEVDILIAKLVEASGYFLTTEEAARKLSRVAIIGLPPELIETLPRLMEIARAIALVSDEFGTAEQVFDKFIDAIGRAQMRMATATGTVSGTMEDALDRFRQFVPAMEQMVASGSELPPALVKITQMLIDSGAATITSVEALSEYQKSLLITWSILANGEQVLMALDREFDKNITRIQEMDYTTKELWKTVGIVITQALGIPKLTKNISDSSRSAAGSLAMLFDQLFAPERYARRMEETAQRVDEIISQMTEEEIQRLREPAVARLVSLGIRPTEELIQQSIRQQLIQQIYAGKVAFEVQAQAAKEADDSLIDYLNSLRDILGTSEDTTNATEELSNALSGLQSAATQFASVYVDYLHAIEDAEIEHQRWYEDLMRDYHRKLEELEEGQEKDRARERADRDKRRRDAAEQLARRLWEIEQNLASKLLDIWRDFNDEMFMAELDRDALRAFLAARRRDRQIAEAHEWAERERQEAYMRYQEQIREIEDAFNRRMAEIEERMRDERERIQRWLEREMEDRARYEQRQTEDRNRQYERRYADLLRSLMLEFELQQIMNDKSISEEERFMRMMSAIFTAYNATFAADARNTYAALRSGAQQYFDWLWYIFRTYYERMLQYRSAMLPLLTSPITSGVGNAPGAGGQRPRRYASGGAEIVTTPTHFIAGEAGPELVVAIPMRGMNANLTHNFNAVINTAAEGIAGRINAAVIQTLENVLRQVM